MNAKQKARDLFEKIKKHTECKCYSWDDDNAKDSAIVCVDEILSILSEKFLIDEIAYWGEVKKEIKRI
jgi:hypothetical protein